MKLNFKKQPDLAGIYDDDEDDDLYLNQIIDKIANRKPSVDSILNNYTIEDIVKIFGIDSIQKVIDKNKIETVNN
jgi:hypothetical protein